jgi:hypothetical protein
MPRGRSLYGSITTQLEDPNSFASQLKGILRLRKKHHIEVATQVDIPDVAHRGMLVMVHRLDGGDASLENAQLQVTVLNFSGETIEGTVRSDQLAPQSTVTDAACNAQIGVVDDLGSFTVQLPPYGRMFLLVGAVL